MVRLMHWSPHSLLKALRPLVDRDSAYGYRCTRRSQSFLLEEGWAVSPGERYRFNTPPGIRITTTELAPKDAAKLAAALAAALQSSQATYAA